MTSIYNTTRFTALAAGDVIGMVDVSDTTQSAHGSLDSITVTNFFGTIPVPVLITSIAAAAFAVGRQGSTTPAFQVDASAASQVAGLKVAGAATAGTVAVSVTDSGSNASLSINAKGTGDVIVLSSGTGAFKLGRPIQFSTSVALSPVAGQIGWDSTAGITIMCGAGSATDFTLQNKNGQNVCTVDTGSTTFRLAADIRMGTALTALGGGAAPTLGTIGGSGPATAAQNSWQKIVDSTGASFWVPAWK